MVSHINYLKEPKTQRKIITLWINNNLILRIFFERYIREKRRIDVKMKRNYKQLRVECVPFETESPILASSGVAEQIIEPVNVNVHEFSDMGFADADFGTIDFN